MDADRLANCEVDLLLDQARIGSKDAVCRLFETHRQSLCRLFRSLLTRPLRRIFDSEDFVQELAVKLWTHDLPRDVFLSDSAFSAYLKVTAKNILHDYERRYLVLKKRNLHRDRAVQQFRAKLATAQPPANTVDIKELFEDWSTDLSPVQRRVVLLMRAGHDQHSIAVQLKISERTLRRMLHRLSQLPPPPILP